MKLRVWVLLNALDALQTWVALSVGALEANSFLSTLIDSLGLEQAMLIKLSASAVLGVLLWFLGRHGVWEPLLGTMALVIAWNQIATGFELMGHAL